MRKLWLALTPLVLAAAGCDSTISDALDGTLQRRINTMDSCFPILFEKADQLLKIANSWRMDTTTPVPDPAGLTWSQQGNGSLLVTLVAGNCTFTMTIRFYSPTGVEQTDLPLGTQSTLSEAIDDAATELRNRFGAADKFMVGDWSMTGDGTGSGAITGIIGGSTNQNELERIKTSEATVSGGEPATADGTIDLADCDLTFRTGGTGLVTDDSPTQEYPDGTLTLTVVGEETVTATVTFDRTVNATIVVDNVPGSFTFNLDSYDIDYAP